MKNAQERLDRGAKVMMRLAEEMQEGAREACAAGENRTSSRLWIMAGLQLIAYGIGRDIVTSDGISAKRKD